MADDKKKPAKPESSKKPAKLPAEPFMNLELPASSDSTPDIEELLEVLEVEEEAIPTVGAAPPPAEDIEEVIEVLETSESGDSLSEEEVMKLLDFFDETEAAPKEVAQTPAHGGAVTEPRQVMEGLEEVLDAEAASDPRMQRPPLTDPKAKPRPVPPTITDVDLGGNSLEIFDVSGGLPSSSESGKPLVEGNKPEGNTSEKGQAGEGEDNVLVDYEELLVESESDVDVGKQGSGKSDRHSGVDIIAEALESGIDIHREHTPPPKPAHQPTISDSDINFESILGDRNESASSVDLGGSDERPSLAPHSEERRAKQPESGKEGRTEIVTDEDAAGAEIVGEDLLIDPQPTELHVGQDDEYLVSPKQAAVAPEEEVIAGLEDSSTDVHAVVEEPTDETFLEAPEPVEETVREASEPVEAPPPIKSKKPKKEERELVGAGVGKSRGGFVPFLLGVFLATLIAGGGGFAAWYLDVVPASPNASKKAPSPIAVTPAPVVQGPALSEAQQARDLIDEGKYAEAIDVVKDAKAGPELAMLGLANFKKYETEKKTVKLSDPEVENALKQIDEGGGKNVAADIRTRLKATEDLAAYVAGTGKVGERVQELEAEKLKLQGQLTGAMQTEAKTQAQLDGIKTALADAKLPAEADKLKAALSGAMGNTNAKATELAAAEAKLLAAEAQLDEFKDALAKTGIKTNGGKGIADLAAARDALAKDVQNLDSTLEAGLKELKDANLLGNDPDRTKQLVEGIKKARSAGESPLSASIAALAGPLMAITTSSPGMFQKVFDTTKLSTELAAAKATSIFAETPEQRINTILLLLNDRSFKDAKELENSKRFVDWVRSKDAKASPEAKTKALLAAALIERNLENYAAARQNLEAALKEAQASKTPDAVQKTLALRLQELSDPTIYFLPEADRRLAEGDTKGALAALNAGLKVMPDNAFLHMKHAQAALAAARQSGPLSEAAAQAIRDDAVAARNDGTLAAESFYLIGQVDETLGQWAKAEASYRQALQLGGAGSLGEKYRAALARVLQHGLSASNEREAPQQEDEELEETSTTFVAFVVEDGQGDDALTRKRLEESIGLAKELIQSTNSKTQGEGYMLLGAAQSRLGKSNEGLKNFVKGLKLLYPDWAANELDKMVAENPAFSQPDVMPQANPLLADLYFNKGLSLFWAHRYSDAEREFEQAVSFVGQDPRYRYFLGMSRYGQASKVKQKLAVYDFEQGARLEASSPTGTATVNASLERVQGELRRVLNGYREGALGKR